MEPEIEKTETIEPEKDKLIEKPVENDSVKEVQDFLSGYKEPMIVEQDDFIDHPKKETRGRKKGSTKNKAPVNEIPASSVISGAMFLLLIDIAMPNIIALVNNRFAKNKITASSMQMTRQQKEELSPLADEVAKQLMLKGNPVTVLIFSLIGIYGINFMAQHS
jgi:hypothetical protein